MTEVIRAAPKQLSRVKHHLLDTANVELTGRHLRTSSLPSQGPSTRLEPVVMPRGTRLARAPALLARSPPGRRPLRRPDLPDPLHRPGPAGEGARALRRIRFRPPPLRLLLLRPLHRRRLQKPYRKDDDPDQIRRKSQFPAQGLQLRRRRYLLYHLRRLRRIREKRPSWISSLTPQNRPQ